MSIGVSVYKDYAWKSVLKYTEVRMDSLEIIPIKSLEEYNTSKSAHFYWLDNVENLKLTPITMRISLLCLVSHIYMVII